MALTKTPIELSSTPGIVDNSNATAITIDSSERVLIGKTATGLGASGTEINPNGYIQVTEDQSPPLYLNRLNTDGSIVNFYKDSAIVGGIGTGSSLLTIGTGTGNLVFADALVAPCSDSSVGSSNGVVDLGASSRRFKDLYLSGGAYLGGTAAANKLEDYEEGTWTPTDGGTADASINIISANYTKIGRLVTISIYVTVTATSAIGARIGGLPFTPIAGNAFAVSPINHNGSVGTPLFRVNTGSTEATVINFDNSNVTFASLNGSILITSITYMTA